jgi:hypothetical protein
MVAPLKASTKLLGVLVALIIRLCVQRSAKFHLLEQASISLRETGSW